MAGKLALGISVVVLVVSVVLAAVTAVEGREVSIVFTGEVPAEYSPDPKVYISGEVNSPGVYQFATGTRVNDALAAAGGFTENADPHQVSEINLATGVTDGMHLHIAAKQISTVSGTARSPQISSSGGLINVNSASAEELDLLPGIGPATAAKIISNRPYKTADDLLNVPGIGASKLSSIRDLVSF